MNSVTIKDITLKLENAPQSVLDRVLEYVDALVNSTTSTKPYNLTNEQQQILDNQLLSDKSTYVDAEKLYTDLKKKYGL